MEKLNSGSNQRSRLFMSKLLNALIRERTRKNITPDMIASHLGYDAGEYVRIEKGEQPLYLSDFFNICDLMCEDPREIIRDLAKD
ncbi:helix-turn-helix domain-containing protein [Mucilaginibacter conchicola]|nr:helix-turn-helix domain-containing protein [Mucilaginibacter conchicola]